MSPSFNVWFCLLCNGLPLVLKLIWASLMAFSMLVIGSCKLSVFFPMCLPTAKQRAADRTLPQQYPAGSRLGHNIHGVRQDYCSLVSLSCEKLSKAVKRGKINSSGPHPGGVGGLLSSQLANLSEQNCSVSLCSVPSNYESISPLDDLAFDMYQDPEVARIIRVLDQKKQEMFRQEKYEEAKNLKQAIADLQKVGQPHTKYLNCTTCTVCTAEWTSDP